MAKNKLSYETKMKIIYAGAGVTVLLIVFSIWFGLVRTGIL